MTIKLIVGLRNPGKAYAATRHNAGAWFLEALADKQHVVFQTHKKMLGDVADVVCEPHRYSILLPNTFMNHSGQSVRAFCDFYHIQPHEIVIAHDDLDLLPGRVKLKTGGGHGGHNGLRDIITHLGSTDFHRLRLGIGHPGDRTQVLDYVLGKPSSADKLQLAEAVARAIDIMPLLLSGAMASAMNQLNI